MNVEDAVVVGSGPNGLAAAVTLARAGRSVLVLEGADHIGGGTRSEELTLPGVLHDVCSAIQPMARISPFFEALGLTADELDWIDPPVAAAHPFDDGHAAVLAGGVDETARGLGADGGAWRALMDPVVRDWARIVPTILAPMGPPAHPVAMGRFGLRALRSARGLARARFRGRDARGLFAGLAAHSVLPLERTASAAVAVVLAGAAHVRGWPQPRGGAGRIADALAARLTGLGGRLETGRRVRTLADLPPARVVLFDVTARQLARIAGDALPPRYVRRLEGLRPGPGVFKVDWALSGPIPWTAEACRSAGTVHLGGTLEEVAASERAAWRGEHVERPFVLLTQPSLFDRSRAPAGTHVGWAYCHVPTGSTVDMTARIEAQVERFAPGFGDLVLARHTLDPAALERRNPNLAGGDIGGGAHNLGQLVRRPTLGPNPYATPNPKFYLCSSSTPPGGGVHGMCGFHAAQAALRAMG